MSKAWGTYSGFGVGFYNEIFDVQKKANSEEQKNDLGTKIKLQQLIKYLLSQIRTVQTFSLPRVWSSEKNSYLYKCFIHSFGGSNKIVFAVAWTERKDIISFDF